MEGLLLRETSPWYGKIFVVICADIKLVIVMTYLALSLSVPKFTFFGDNRNIWGGGRGENQLFSLSYPEYSYFIHIFTGSP